MGQQSSVLGPQVTLYQFPHQYYALKNRLTTGLAVWKSRNPPYNQLLQYKITTNSQQQLRQIYQKFLFRYQHRYLVSTLFLQCQQTGIRGCGQLYKGSIYYQQPIAKLSQINDIPFQDTLHMYIIALHGFNILYKKYGYFDIFQDMFQICENGKFKIWCNCAVYKLQVEQYLLDVTGKQEDMIYRIIHIIDSNADQGETRSMKKQLQRKLSNTNRYSNSNEYNNNINTNNEYNGYNNNRRLKTFEQTLYQFRQICRQNDWQPPQQLNCIAGFDKQQIDKLLTKQKYQQNDDINNYHDNNNNNYHDNSNNNNNNRMILQTFGGDDPLTIRMQQQQQQSLLSNINNSNKYMNNNNNNNNYEQDIIPTNKNIPIVQTSPIRQSPQKYHHYNSNNRISNNNSNISNNIKIIDNRNTKIKQVIDNRMKQYNINDNNIRGQGILLNTIKQDTNQSNNSINKIGYHQRPKSLPINYSRYNNNSNIDNYNYHHNNYNNNYNYNQQQKIIIGKSIDNKYHNINNDNNNNNKQITLHNIRTVNSRPISSTAPNNINSNSNYKMHSPSSQNKIKQITNTNIYQPSISYNDSNKNININNKYNRYHQNISTNSNKQIINTHYNNSNNSNRETKRLQTSPSNNNTNNINNNNIIHDNNKLKKISRVKFSPKFHNNYTNTHNIINNNNNIEKQQEIPMQPKQTLSSLKQQVILPKTTKTTKTSQIINNIDLSNQNTNQYNTKHNHHNNISNKRSSNNVNSNNMRNMNNMNNNNYYIKKQQSSQLTYNDNYDNNSDNNNVNNPSKIQKMKNKLSNSYQYTDPQLLQLLNSKYQSGSYHYDTQRNCDRRKKMQFSFNNNNSNNNKNNDSNRNNNDYDSNRNYINTSNNNAEEQSTKSKQSQQQKYRPAVDSEIWGDLQKLKDSNKSKFNIY